MQSIWDLKESRTNLNNIQEDDADIFDGIQEYKLKEMTVKFMESHRNLEELEFKKI